jgi:pyrimidine-nucleoside phosphorylase
MAFLDLIERKRDGGALSPDEIQGFVREVVAGALPREQVSAFLMAVLFRGMDDSERRTLTLAMRDSGEVLAWTPDPRRPVVDKHSTGGVGDKVSLPLAPLLASLGFRVPMISGRGLGITGGTLDKLESIPGFSTRLSSERIRELVEVDGVAMVGQTDRMVPADRILYALRDVTGTVPSRDLITASILSKKLAEGLEALVLDVKCGAAAFMRTRAEATRLAESLEGLANQCGVGTRAFVTRMDQPLGRSAGNWLEVVESVECLRGRGPADLRELVCCLAGSLMVQTGRADDLAAAIGVAAGELDSGRPLAVWQRMLERQGADMDAYSRKLRSDVLAPVVQEVRSPASGCVCQVDARLLGEALRRLGAGRLQSGDVVDPEVGFDRIVQVGDSVSAGDVLVRIHARSENAAETAISQIANAFRIQDSPVDREAVRIT